MKMLRAVLFLFVVFVAARGQFNNPNRAQQIGNAFQIPIQTLSAISNFAQGTRPVGDFLQQRLMKKMMKFQSQNQNQNQNQDTYDPVNFGSSSNNVFTSQRFYYGNGLYSRSKAAQVAGVYTAQDGSGFRI